MKTTNRRMNWPLTAVAGLLLVTMTCQALAFRGSVMRPTTVVTINLERVFENIDGKRSADTELQDIAKALEVEGSEKQAIILDLEEELDAFPVGSEMRQDVERQLQWAALDYSAFVEFSRRKLDVEKAQMLLRIYESIKAASSQMAVQQGYDMVVVDDSVTLIPQGSETEVRRQISARRIVHADAAIDVTDELIQRMNL